MATVIRVKRRIDEEPLNAFVLNCKKRKYDDVDDDASTSFDEADGTSATVMKFAGTVEKQDNIESHIQKLSKAEAVDITNRVRRPINVAARNRIVQKQNAQEDRFKIVNCFRTMCDADASTSSSALPKTGSSTVSEVQTACTVVDIERNPAAVGPIAASTSTPLEEAATSASLEEENYVYDLYMADSSHNPQMTLFIEDLLSVKPVYDLTYENARDNGLDGTSDASDDSNDEDNWRNDYPDTEEEDDASNSDNDDDDSINESRMRKAMNYDDDLSSDYDESTAVQQGFVHSMSGELEKCHGYMKTMKLADDSDSDDYQNDDGSHDDDEDSDNEGDNSNDSNDNDD